MNDPIAELDAQLAEVQPGFFAVKFSHVSLASLLLASPAVQSRSQKRGGGKQRRCRRCHGAGGAARGLQRITTPRRERRIHRFGDRQRAASRDDYIRQRQQLAPQHEPEVCAALQLVSSERSGECGLVSAAMGRSGQRGLTKIDTKIKLFSLFSRPRPCSSQRRLSHSRRQSLAWRPEIWPPLRSPLMIRWKNWAARAEVAVAAAPPELEASVNTTGTAADVRNLTERLAVQA